MPRPPRGHDGWEFRLYPIVCVLCNAAPPTPAKYRVHMRRAHRLERTQIATEIRNLRRSLGILTDAEKRSYIGKNVRRLFKAGKSVSITLPPEWIHTMGLHPGRFLSVERETGGSALILRALPPFVESSTPP